MRCAIVLGAILASATAATAQSWSILGVGQESCGSFLVSMTKHRPTEAIDRKGELFYSSTNAYLQWIVGFIAASDLHVGEANRTTEMDIDGVALWIKQYCSEHRMDRIALAAAAYVVANRNK